MIDYGLLKLNGTESRPQNAVNKADLGQKIFISCLMGIFFSDLGWGELIKKGL